MKLSSPPFSSIVALIMTTILQNKLLLTVLSLTLTLTVNISLPESIIRDGDSSTQISAWSCNLKDSLQFSEYSLMRVGRCANISNQYSNPSIHNGQLIQAKKYEDISVLLCSLKASFYTASCSYSLITGSRLWGKENRISNIQIELTRSECENALTSKILKYTDRTYYAKHNFLTIDLSPANTASGWMTLRGQSQPETGKCNPESFQLERKTYNSHLLMMKYEVEIKWIHAVFSTARRVIRLDKHTLIPSTLTGSYFSPQLGNFHYDKIDDGNLTDHHWVEITRGGVQLYEPTSMNGSMPIAILQTHETEANLAFSLYKQTKICISFSCRQAYKVELKDVYLIIFDTTGQSHWPLELASGSEVNRLLNLEASLASVYLTRELALSSSFEKISRALCERSRETILSNIQNYVSNVLIQQDVKEEDTRFFLRAGSVLYAIKCFERIAILRTNSSKCHKDVPIFYTNSHNKQEAAFLDPITYIIKPYSSPVPCNDILPFKFNLLSIDGSSTWICKNSNGYDVDYSPPITLEPLHPGKLYQPQDKKIIPSMYSETQLLSLENIQWQETHQKVDIQEWESYLQKIKTRNPNVSVMTYFENIKNAIDEVSHIFSKNFWIQLAFKHFMPIILINYIATIIFHIIKTIIRSSRVYKTAGINITFFLHILIGAITSFFPIISKFESNIPNQCSCPCTETDFVRKITKAVEEEERQKFLNNLNL